MSFDALAGWPMRGGVGEAEEYDDGLRNGVRALNNFGGRRHGGGEKVKGMSTVSLPPLLASTLQMTFSLW